MNNQSLERVPVGFLDDDRSKHRTRIHGIPVLGGAEDIAMLLNRHAVQEVVVSSPKIQGGMLDHVIDACNRLDVPVRRASIRLE